MGKLHLATFRVEVTPPLGHPLCGGWIKPVLAVGDPLYAHGIVLLGNEAPVVMATVDWCGVCNMSYDRLCAIVAEATHTTADRVAVHAVHQHNAPFVDETGQAQIAKAERISPIVHVAWSHEMFAKIAAAANASLGLARPVTHFGCGAANVAMVASNRRLVANGKLTGWRGSACKDAKLRALPDGAIDPKLRTIAFWSNDALLAGLHFYAVHPMSYYGDGIVNADFVGMARAAFAKETGAPQLYFTGCAGNIAAGKYNDGDSANRYLLATRIHRAMKESTALCERRSAEKFAWRTTPLSLAPRSDDAIAALEATIRDAKQANNVRGRAAMKLAYRQYVAAGHRISLSRLDLFDDRGPGASIASLPAESFLEYQLEATRLVGNRFIAVAAYGQGGPWYIPTEVAFREGGYEPSASFVEPDSETAMRAALATLLTG